MEILNSKSEFSRCRVPRLVINLEEWKTKSKEKDTIAEKADTGSNTATEADEEDEALIKALEETEKETRRKEGKRKEGKEGGGRQPKRRKLEKLTNWGEPNILDDIQEETVVGNIISSYISSCISPMEQEVMIVKDRVVLETESIEMAVKLRKKKEEISKEVKKKKFIFNTRGKLTKDEQKEMVRTHRGGLFD